MNLILSSNPSLQHFSLPAAVCVSILLFYLGVVHACMPYLFSE